MTKKSNIELVEIATVLLPLNHYPCFPSCITENKNTIYTHMFLCVTKKLIICQLN